MVFNNRVLMALLLSILMTEGRAATFASQYCEFELPPGWSCSLEGTEWVCQAVNKERKKEAIIILAAKIRGDQDSLPLYQAYLKKQKVFKLPGGKTQVSEVKTSSTIKEIAGHRWVDSLHMASEVPGFYTRYLATVKEDLGIAVTFSVGKDFYDSYQNLFDKVISTLKVFRQTKKRPTTFARVEHDVIDGEIDHIPDDSGPVQINPRQRPEEEGSASSEAANYLFYLILIAGVGLFIIKSRKKKKKKKKRKKS